MNIKSTKNKTPINWFAIFAMDKLTFVFSLVAGVLLGFMAMGFGTVGPIFIGLGVTLMIASFGAMDAGIKGFIYVNKLGIYTVIAANLLVLYPSTKFDYDKRSVMVEIVDKTMKKGEMTVVTLYDKRTNEIIAVKSYTADKKELVKKLYANTKFIKYNVRYFPLIKYSRTMEFYDD